MPDGSHIYVKQEENGQVELVQLQGAELNEGETAEETETQIQENADDNSGQVVAQLIEAGEPNPAGNLNLSIYIYLMLKFPRGILLVKCMENVKYVSNDEKITWLMLVDLMTKTKS